MAMRSGFFNSVNGDRKYSAKDFAEFFASFIGNGVFPNPYTNLQVMANNDMTVTVKPGKGWIDGHIVINDDDHILQIDPADGLLNRIDRVVARYVVVDREIRIEVKKGIFSSSPEAPALQRDSDAYELGIADIVVNKGAVSISQANITDTRMSSELCGIVHGLIEQIDLTTLFNQYQDWIVQKKGEFDTDLIDYTNLKHNEIDGIIADFQSDFMAWFTTIQGILDENVAGNLALMIGDTSKLKTDDKSSLVNAVNELFTNVSDGKEMIATAITDKKIETSGSDTFETMASNVRRINISRYDFKKFSTYELMMRYNFDPVIALGL